MHPRAWLFTSDVWGIVLTFYRVRRKIRSIQLTQGHATKQEQLQMNSKRIKVIVLFGLLGFGLSGAMLVASILQSRETQVLPNQPAESAQSTEKPAERTWQAVSTLTGQDARTQRGTARGQHCRQQRRDDALQDTRTLLHRRHRRGC